MAKKTAEQAAEEPSFEVSRLKKIVIQNYRCIGSTPVEIDLDDIVVLVGPNNAGKSTILRAYELIMSGPKAATLALSDFPNEDRSALPHIELQTYINDSNAPAARWLYHEAGTNRAYVRERWVWDAPGQPPRRQGRKPDAADWESEVPWGYDNVALGKRPQPHRLDAFASPEEQAGSIIKLLAEVLVKSAQTPKPGEDGTASATSKLKEYISTVQRDVLRESQEAVDRIEGELGTLIAKVFHGFKVSLKEATPEEISDKTINALFSGAVLRMGPEGGYLTPIDKQGSGARRTLLWAALKLLGEQASAAKQAKKGRASSPEGEQRATTPHVLLIDEPEICLHPNAVRDACRVLYDLAEEGGGWQVMVTTHSPVFIDLSRPNTTIARVERSNSGTVTGTTIFRPDRAQLDDDDRLRLKLLNVWDPYVGEFFFGGKTVLVEGDTEYSAFRYIIDEDRDSFPDVHVVRARGKAILVSLIKILNHFGSGYAILHDSDRPTNSDGNRNAMWTENERILAAIGISPSPAQIRLIASVPNFEEAMFGSPAGKDKPYRAVESLKADQDLKARVRQLLVSLLDLTATPPQGALASWATLGELEQAVAAADAPKAQSAL